MPTAGALELISLRRRASYAGICMFKAYVPGEGSLTHLTIAVPLPLASTPSPKRSPPPRAPPAGGAPAG
jgi:hypothetical protein